MILQLVTHQKSALETELLACRQNLDAANLTVGTLEDRMQHLVNAERSVRSLHVTTQENAAALRSDYESVLMELEKVKQGHTTMDKELWSN